MTKVTVTAARAFPFSPDGTAVRRVQPGEKIEVNSSRVAALEETGKIRKVSRDEPAKAPDAKKV